MFVYGLPSCKKTHRIHMPGLTQRERPCFTYQGPQGPQPSRFDFQMKRVYTMRKERGDDSEAALTGLLGCVLSRLTQR